MKRETIIRAWKDPEFRASLSTEERSSLPECPAGPAFTELSESDLEDAVGGAVYNYDFDGCICSPYTGGNLTKTWTTTKTLTVNQLDLVTVGQLDVALYR